MKFPAQGTRQHQQASARPAWRGCLLAGILFLLLARPALALQPAFIKGTVSSAYDNALLYNAVIETSTGISAQTSSGYFYFRVPPNFYNIIISAPGYTANMLSGILASPGQTANVNIWLVPASTTTGYLEGRILDAANFKPIKSAFIAVDLGGAAVSDNNGYFNMQVPSGTATITASATSFASKTIQQLFLRPERTERIVIYLKKKRTHTVTITGLVKNACSGEKLSGAQIMTATGDFAVSNNGTYSLEIESGPSTVIATAQGYQYAYKTGSFAGYFFPSIVNMNLLPLEKSFGLLRGNIKDALSGAALAEAKIVSDTGSISFSGSDGAFKLYTSTCTSYITVSKSGFNPKQVSLAVTPGSATFVRVALEPADNATLGSADATDTSSTPFVKLANGTAAFYGPLISAYRDALPAHAAELASVIAEDAALRESFLRNFAQAWMVVHASSMLDAASLPGYNPDELLDFLERLGDRRLSENLQDSIHRLATDVLDGSFFEDVYLVQEN